MKPRQADRPSSGWSRAFLFGLAGLVAYLLIWVVQPALQSGKTEVELFGYSFSEDGMERVYRDKNGKRINEPAYNLMRGYDLASEKGIASHAECDRLENHRAAAGCHRYVTEHKAIPPHVVQTDFDSGKTTAQCRAEVMAYYDAVMQDMIEQKDERGARRLSEYHRDRELDECMNYDKVRIGLHGPDSQPLQEPR